MSDRAPPSGSVPPAIWTLRTSDGSVLPSEPGRGHRVPAGSVIAGKYVVDEPIGRGASSTVYAAEQTAIGRPVAIKLSGKTTPDSVTRERMIREARLLGAFTSESLVRVYEAGWLETGPAAVVMERLVGETLRQRIAREGPLPPADVIAIVCEVLGALTEVHDKYVLHRDLNPSNVFLAKHRGGIMPKLIDFGLGKDLGDSSDLTAAGHVVGTPAYLAPEQLAQDKNVDARADLYTMGATVFEALTGRPPFVAPGAKVVFQVLREPPPRPSSLMPALGDRFDAFVEKALEKKAASRFQTAAEMADALRALG